ncbi:Holliday junction branch migration DNA helicase RuvB, partial [Streptomyces sp. NPDC001812]
MTRDEAETAALIGRLVSPAAERLVGSVADGEDQAVEAALRPKDLDEFI